MSGQLVPIWNAFKKWWWLIVLSAGLAGFTAGYFSSQQPVLYVSTVSLRVGAGSERPNASTLQYGGSLAQIYETLAHRRPIAQAVIEKLNLNILPEELTNLISTRTLPQAQILEITVFASTPEIAADLANAIGLELVNQSTPASERAVDFDFVASELEKTQEQIGEIDLQIDELRDRRLSLTSAADLAEANQTLSEFETVKQSLRTDYVNLANLINSRSSSSLSIIEPARVNPIPLGRNTGRDRIFGAVGGIILALVAVMLIEFLDDSLRWDNVAADDGLPLLGIVPALSRRSKRNPLIVKASPHSAEADALRSLRTRIFIADSGAMIKRLLITSPAPRDGKSFTTVNLAVAAADAGMRVIIVDGDIRAGSIHEYFGLEREPGLTNLLWSTSVGQTTFPDLLRRTKVDNLSVLTSGTYSRDPMMLLGTPRMRQLLDVLSERADLIIIDSPPVSAGPIATLLSTAADAIVIVASIDRTRRKLFENAKQELLRNAEAPVLGMALNRVQLHKLNPENGFYGYNYYGYGNSHTEPRSLPVRVLRAPLTLANSIARKLGISKNGQRRLDWLEDTPHEMRNADETMADEGDDFTLVTASDLNNSPDSDSEIMTIAEAALRLAISESEVEELCHSGQLPCVRIGKRWLVTQLIEPTPAHTPDPELIESD